VNLKSRSIIKRLINIALQSAAPTTILAITVLALLRVQNNLWVTSINLIVGTRPSLDNAHICMLNFAHGQIPHLYANSMLFVLNNRPSVQATPSQITQPATGLTYPPKTRPS
jgi:hypothetical protein